MKKRLAKKILFGNTSFAKKLLLSKQGKFPGLFSTKPRDIYLLTKAYFRYRKYLLNFLVYVYERRTKYF